MAKLTATEFGALKPAAAYSAYDDSFAGVEEARAAQAASLAQTEKDAEAMAAAKDAHAEALKAKDEEHATALKELTAAKDAILEDVVTTKNAALAARDTDLATAKAHIEDLKVTHADEIAAKNAEVIYQSQQHVVAIDALKAAHAKGMADAKTLIDAMGGTTVGKQLAKEKRLAELAEAKQAAIDAKKKAEDEIAAIQAGG